MMILFVEVAIILEVSIFSQIVFQILNTTVKNAVVWDLRNNLFYLKSLEWKSYLRRLGEWEVDRFDFFNPFLTLEESWKIQTIEPSLLTVTFFDSPRYRNIIVMVWGITCLGSFVNNWFLDLKYFLFFIVRSTILTVGSVGWWIEFRNTN